MRIIKVDKEHILNETVGLGIGYTGDATHNNPGFSYEIKPLSFSLCQNGNDPMPDNNNKAFKYFIGDVITGKGEFDGKKYKGMIKHMEYFPNSDEEKPNLIYILDFETLKIIALDPKTISSFKTMTTNNQAVDYFASRQAEIDHDFAAVSPVRPLHEKFDFNKHVNK